MTGPSDLLFRNRDHISAGESRSSLAGPVFEKSGSRGWVRLGRVLNSSSADICTKQDGDLGHILITAQSGFLKWQKGLLQLPEGIRCWSVRLHGPRWLRRRSSYGKCQLTAFSRNTTMSNGNKPQHLEAPSRAVQNTSLGTAYFRSFSDIPNAMAVAGMLGARDAYYTEYQDLDYSRASIPHFESRYKAIDALIHKSRVHQVVEFGAGHSTRGINSPAQWNYVHTDQDLRSVGAMEAIAKDLRLDRGNLHFVRFDAVNGAGMQEMLECLEAQPLAVIHEGILGYYPHDIKAKIAKRAHRLLERYSGVYITTDIYSKEHSRQRSAGDSRASYARARRIGNECAKRMGRDLYSFMFETDHEFKIFFERLGFAVRVYQQRELVNHLTSVHVLYPDEKQRNVVEEKTLARRIFEMTLK